MGCRISLMSFDEYPPAMTNYLENYGYHFSKKAYEFAARLMKRKNASTGRMEPVAPMTKEDVDSLLSRAGITLENDTLYDAAYVGTMCRADFYGSSVPDEGHLARFIKDKLDDADQKDGYIFVQWYAALCLAGIPISWEDIM